MDIVCVEMKPMKCEVQGLTLNTLTTTELWLDH